METVRLFRRRVWKTGEKEVVKIRLSDGRLFRCTPDHRFMTISGDECRL